MSTATLPKNVLVTGANGGIGRLTCQLLVADGAALGALTDQRPLHPAFTDVQLQQALWAVIEETVGPLRKLSAA